MHLSLFLIFVPLFTLTFAEFEENVTIDDSIFGSLELPDSPKKFKVKPRVTDYSDILALSNAIRNYQKMLEEEYNTADYLTNKSNVNKNRKEFISGTLVYSKVVSMTEINELLTNVTSANSSKIANCSSFVPINQTNILVEVVNSTRLGYVLKSNPEVLNRSMDAICSLVLFYSKSCYFSLLADPHFNVLQIVFPQIKMVAFDSTSDQRYNTIYGITGLPSLVLFHNGKPVAKYNDSDYTLYEFTKFVIKHTGLFPNNKMEISVKDFLKIVPGFENLDDYDFYLWLSWFVIIFWTLYFGYMRTMDFWSRFVEDIKNIWREAEAQNEHID